MRRNRATTAIISMICALVVCSSSYAASQHSAARIKLAPEREEQGSLSAADNTFAVDQQSPLFDTSATSEAQERLRVLNRSLEDKQRYQLDTRQDLERYQNENHQLALWYAKALIKSLLRGFVNDKRDQIRHERERDKIQERAQSESQMEKEPRVVNRGRAPALAHAPVTQDEPSALGTIVKDAIRFVDNLTDQGVSIALPVLSANFRLNARTTVLETRLHSAILDMSMNYQVPIAEGATAFGKPLVERASEQISLSGSRSFQEIGLSAGVSYQVRGQHLSCAVAKHVIGPLSAQVERQWGFTDGQQESSTASLNVSMTF